MGTPSVSDALHTEDHPAFARGSDTRHLAGDVLPFPISPKVVDMRRTNNENFIGTAAKKFGASTDDIRRAMNKLYPSDVVRGPGSND